MSDDGDDDEWYEKMAQAAYDKEEFEEEYSEHLQFQRVKEIDEDDYYDKVLENNTLISDNIFKTENDIIWQSLARQIITDSTIINTPLIRIFPEETSLILVVEQWLFSFLPMSIKVLNIIKSSQIQDPNSSFKYKIFIDDKLHPSFIAIGDFDQNLNVYQLTFFSPYNLFEQSIKFTNYLKAIEIDSYPSCSLKISAIDSHLFEFIHPHIPGFEISWTESCYLYLLPFSFQSSIQGLDPRYYYSELNQNDAYIINETWKYKNDESIKMVRNMIASGRGMGIKFKNKESQGDDDELVSWCLVYEDLALGMLFTKESHRGLGLARQVVMSVLLKYPSSSPSFCFIEFSNTSSMKLFDSLGFNRVANVMWAGMKRLKNN